MSRELLRLSDISHIADPFDPTNVDQIVYPSEATEAYLKRWASRATATRNLVIYGPPGTGKTRASILLAKQRCAEFLDEDPIRYVECESGTFDELLQIQKNESTVFGRAACSSFESVVILDEVDNYIPPQQKQLKKVMERADQCYILLTNHITKLDSGLRNRCYEIPWFVPTFEACVPRLQEISFKLLNKSLDQDTLRSRVYTTSGWRQMLRNLDALA